MKKFFLVLLLSILHFHGVLSCPGVEIVPRSGWGGRFTETSTSIVKPVKHIFICHTVTPQCYSLNDCSSQMRSMHKHHVGLGWGGIGYNFVIGGDGRVYEGAGWDTVGAHTFGWNSKSYGIAFIGNFMETKPNERMLRAARKLIVCGINEGHISKNRAVHGARDGVCTQSPGTHLYEIIKHWPGFQGGSLDGYQCLGSEQLH